MVLGFGDDTWWLLGAAASIIRRTRCAESATPPRDRDQVAVNALAHPGSPTGTRVGSVGRGLLDDAAAVWAVRAPIDAASLTCSRAPASSARHAAIAPRG